MKPHEQTHEQTMDCKAIFAALSEYLDMELPPDACEKIQAHLASCAPCVDFVSSLRKTVDLCRQYQPAELPEPIGREAREKLFEAYRQAVARR